MSDIKSGLSNITAAYLGTSTIAKIYLGNTLVHGGIVIPGSGKQIHSGWVPENDNIVAYWRFDESSYAGTAGEVAATVGGAGLNGTASNLILTNASPIVPGNCALFPTGNYAHITMTDANGAMNFNGDFSISCWLYIHADQKSGIFERGSTNSQFSLLVEGPSVGNRDLIFRVANSDCDTPMNIYVDQWIHVVCLYQKSTKYIDLYVNGVRVRWITGTQVMASIPSAPVAIGALTTAYGTHSLDGSIDELCLWKTLLTPTEIATIYNHQKP